MRGAQSRFVWCETPGRQRRRSSWALESLLVAQLQRVSIQWGGLEGNMVSGDSKGGGNGTRAPRRGWSRRCAGGRAQGRRPSALLEGDVLEQEDGAHAEGEAVGKDDEHAPPDEAKVVAA